MSSAFVVVGLLVLAAFALGLLVGWLAWANRPTPDTDQEHTSPPSTNQDLPNWSGRPIADDDRPGVRKPRRTKTEQTVTIAPRGWTAVRNL